MKPNDTVTHVALPDRVLTVQDVYLSGLRIAAGDGTLTIKDVGDNFRPYPPRKSDDDLSFEVRQAYQVWEPHPMGGDGDVARTRDLIAAAQAYLDRLEEEHD